MDIIVSFITIQIIHSTLDIMSTMKSKAILSVAFILWMGFVLAAFFIVQKPDAMTIVNGLASLIETIGLAFLFTLAGTSIGYIIFSRSSLQIESTPRLLISTGIGMGILGLAGFGLAVIGQAHPILLLILLIAIPIFAIVDRSLFLAGNDYRQLILNLKNSAQAAPAWIRWFALSAAALTFLLALAPPVEAFDALFYHLTVPTWWLRDGGLRTRQHAALLVSLPRGRHVRVAFGIRKRFRSPIDPFRFCIAHHFDGMGLDKNALEFKSRMVDDCNLSKHAVPHLAGGVGLYRSRLGILFAQRLIRIMEMENDFR